MTGFCGPRRPRTSAPPAWPRVARCPRGGSCRSAFTTSPRLPRPPWRSLCSGLSSSFLTPTCLLFQTFGHFCHTPVNNVFPRLKLLDTSLQCALSLVPVQPGCSPDLLPSLSPPPLELFSAVILVLPGAVLVSWHPCHLHLPSWFTLSFCSSQPSGAFWKGRMSGRCLFYACL